MNGTSVLYLTVQDSRGAPVPGARVTLRPADRDGPPSELRLDERYPAHVSGAIPPGDYLARAQAPGFAPEEFPVRLEGPELYTSVLLGRPGQPFYREHDRRVYFDPDGERVGALVREPEAGAEEGNRPGGAGARRGSQALERLRALRETDVPERPGHRNLVVLDRGRLARGRRQEGDALEALLQTAPEVVDAGPLIRTPPGEPARFLSRQVEVVVEDGVTLERLEERVRPFGLHVRSHDLGRSRVVVLESRGVPEPAFGALPERLAGLDEIRSARSLLAAPVDPTAAVVPGDAGFALQFYSYVTRIPEAWGELPAAAALGSADVVVAVHDSGVQTSGGGAVVTHPEFSGTVAGGTLSAQPGLSNRKVLFTYDFLSAPMAPGNDTVATQHGSYTAGVISAASDGATGTVGGAPNTRLCGYRRDAGATNQMAHAFAFISGLVPPWRHSDSGYSATEPFPAAFGTGKNPVPGAHIINCSHTFSAVPGHFPDAMQRATLFARGRRGTMLVAAAGNSDTDARPSARWAENLNVVVVSGSSLDLRKEEVRMNYSSYALLTDRMVDFATPSESQNVFPTVHHAPRQFGFPSTARTSSSGDLQGTAAARAGLTSSPAAGTRDLTIDPASAAFAAIVAGTSRVILRRMGDPFHSELHTVSAKVAATGTVTVGRDLGYAYQAGTSELILLGGPSGYTVQFGGTSASAPQAAAIAALVLSANPALTWLEVRELMRRTAVPINLRQRGSQYTAGPSFRYRWVDPGGTDLVTAAGLLDITGGGKTITAGPVARGDRILTLSSTAGIVPRQALLIGAETKLAGAHPLAAPNQARVNVDRTAEFEAGDTVFIGKDTTTVLASPAVAGDTVIWVQSVDGLVPGDRVTLDPTGAAETVTIASVQRMTTAPAASQPPGSFTGDSETGLNLSAPLASGHAQHVTVQVASTQFEGPFTVVSKTASSLTLDAPVTRAHPDDRVVRKQGTEARAVIRVLSPTQVEIDPLRSDHPFNTAGVEHVRVGRVAAYSAAFGHGRLDALEAVRAAKAYTHDERDLVIRNTLADDGVANVAAGEVESPDIWVRNDAATLPAALPDYADAGPHQAPQVPVDPAIFVGTGRNDLEVSGACTSAAEVTFTVEIEPGPGTAFRWSRDGGAVTAGVALSTAPITLSHGVQVRFGSTAAHTPGDRWIVRARQVAGRFLHVRVRNRGTLPFFQRSAFAPTSSPTVLEVARSRLMLCVSDGYPVRRFASVAAAPGPDDMDVVARYTGASPRALYTVEITAAAAGGDTFTWHRDGALGGTVVLSAAALEHPLSDGVRVRFASHTGHQAGDRWDLYARAGADAFLNTDHLNDADPGVAGAFDPSTGRAGTRAMAHARIAGLGAGAAQIDSTPWPEAVRPPTNSPNRARPTHPRRLFALAEAVPHDGALAGFTAKDNNNFSFRELVFARFRFSRNNGADPLEGHLDVDPLVAAPARPFRAEVRATAGTFAAERVRLKVTAKRTGGVEEVRYYRHDGTAWGWDAATPWAVCTPPLEARRADATQPLATGEQWDIQFDGTFTPDASLSEVVIEAQILSDFRDHVVASGTHTVALYQLAPVPKGMGPARGATLPRPASYVFADMASLAPQTAQQAFGPVSDPLDADSLTTRFRTTALFGSTASGDVNAYAVADALVALQRDPASTDTVNLVLRPLGQPAAGFAPVRYFVYRGLRLTDFLAAASGTGGAQIRAAAGASPFLADVWTTFLALNPGATAMPSSVLGYDPAQNASDLLDGVFFRVGSATQLPFVLKGTPLGRWLHAGGRQLGFEVVLEGAGFVPDLAFARLASHEVAVGAPGGTAAQQFARRLEQEKVLHFVDPAAFYGLHLHEGGEVDAPGLAQPYTGQGIFTNVVSAFHTRHALYVDVRGEDGQSLNFGRNHDDGAGNQLATGAAPTAMAARPYATHGWPLVVLDGSAPVPTTEERNEVFLQLPRGGGNPQPVLYVEHGELATPTTPDSAGPFVRGSQLHDATGVWTHPQGFLFPNTGPSGGRQGVAWPLRLRLGREQVAVTPPPTVVPALKYTDAVFGPIDREPAWAGPAPIKWLQTQDGRYVDADTEQGWRQMMQSGVARQTAGTAARSLLYAVATAPDTHAAKDFVPVRGMADGASEAESFFAEAGLFGRYVLEHDQVDDAGTPVRTLQLRERPRYALPPSSALLLGLSQDEMDSLAALSAAGLEPEYGRTLVLDARTLVADASGRTADRWRVGVQGLKSADGTYAAEFPSPDVHVYSTDGQIFASKEFAEAEPLPAAYTRNQEEEKGLEVRQPRERRIGAANPGAGSITIRNDDWRRDVTVGDRLRIGGSAANNGEYTVTSVTLSGADTVIVLAGGALANTQPLGSAFTVAKNIEDFFIDRDQAPAIAGVPRMRTLVDGFAAAVGAASGASAQASLETAVNNFAAEILKRARALARADHTRADDHDRILYWARLKMGVALKSHPFSLASLSGRNALVERFEKKSRGYDLDFASAPGGARKILVTGFDPFQLDLDIETSNPSGSIALALHGVTLPSTSGTKQAYVETAVFPVRYRDFDAGKVEALANPRLSGAGQVSMIITVSQNGNDPWYDLERWASRLRGGFQDNEFVSLAATSVGDATHAEFYQTTLPSTLVPGPFDSPPAATQKLFYDQRYRAQKPSDPEAKGMRHPMGDYGDRPKVYGVNGNTPSPSAVPPAGAKAVEGSGGDYLSNEIMYRVAHRRVKSGSTTLTGHFHVPSPKYAGGGIGDVIAEVEKLIKRWLDSLP